LVVVGVVLVVVLVVLVVGVVVLASETGLDVSGAIEIDL
jgi:hypothetical protein